MSTENKNQKDQNPETGKKQPTKEQLISNMLMNKINFFRETGEIQIKPNFSPENAIKSAFMILQDLEDKNKRPALQVCTEGSISQALFRMVMLGLSPGKGQCAFVVYGKELQLMKQYQGNIKLAKENGLKSIHAQIIYKGEKPQIKIDPDTGRTMVINHNRELEKMDNDNILGAYAVCNMKDGTTDVEVMPIGMIQKAWEQGYNKGNSPAHRNFKDQMCKKTVINRACKLIYQTADDSQLFGNKEEYEDAEYEEIKNDLEIKKEQEPEEEIQDDLSSEAEPQPEPEKQKEQTQPEPEKKKEPQPENNKQKMIENNSNNQSLAFDFNDVKQTDKKKPGKTDEPQPGF